MPRPFLPEHTLPLRRALARRAPACLFTDADVAALCERTGLAPAQVRKWADHFRSRTEPETRLAALQAEAAPDDPVQVVVCPLPRL